MEVAIPDTNLDLILHVKLLVQVASQLMLPSKRDSLPLTVTLPTRMGLKHNTTHDDAW